MIVLLLRISVDNIMVASAFTLSFPKGKPILTIDNILQFALGGLDSEFGR